MNAPDLTEHARKNREFWDGQSAEYDERNARFIERGLAWGLWQVCPYCETPVESPRAVENL